MQHKSHICRPWTEADLDKDNKVPVVVAQLGQSLDGQIATATGQSKYINGPGGLEHLHRLRAWADVVIVGVGTVVADDPMLNVRLVRGSDPHRVVIDPRARVCLQSRMFGSGSVRKVVLVGPEARVDASPAVQVEFVRLPCPQGDMAVASILSWVVSQGWHKILVEGGAKTVTRFLEADCLDFLHLIVSPLLLGEGERGLRVRPIKALDQAKRFSSSVHPLQEDLLIACRF